MVDLSKRQRGWSNGDTKLIIQVSVKIPVISFFPVQPQAYSFSGSTVGSWYKLISALNEQLCSAQPFHLPERTDDSWLWSPSSTTQTRLPAGKQEDNNNSSGFGTLWLITTGHKWLLSGNPTSTVGPLPLALHKQDEIIFLRWTGND